MSPYGQYSFHPILSFILLNLRYCEDFLGCSEVESCHIRIFWELSASN